MNAKRLAQVLGDRYETEEQSEIEGSRKQKSYGPFRGRSRTSVLTSEDQKRWVYFMYRKRPMSKPP